MPLRVAIKRFWGFPIGVITLPMLTAKANEMNSALALDPVINSCFEIWITIGTPNKATVSLTRNADSVPIPTMNKIEMYPYFLPLKAFLVLLA